jgi:hypothetical protein
MSAFLTALRWDVVLQARNGFYWASAFVVLVIGGLLLAIPDTVRSNEAALVPAILAINLGITPIPITSLLTIAAVAGGVGAPTRARTGKRSPQQGRRIRRREGPERRQSPTDRRILPAATLAVHRWRCPDVLADACPVVSRRG